MAAAVKEAEAKKPTNPPKPVAKAGEVVEDPVDYKLTHSDVVIRTKDGAHIPNDPNNADRREYEAWGMAGGVAIPADPPATAAPIPPPEAAPKAANAGREKEHR